MGDKHLGRWAVLLVIGAIVLIILFAFRVGMASANEEEEGRPRYTLALPRAPFINYDMDGLPEFERPICWRADTGYCDTFDNPYMIYLVTDWEDETLGGIWMSGDDCYLMMYYSNAEHPYIGQWLNECPDY